MFFSRRRASSSASTTSRSASPANPNYVAAGSSSSVSHHKLAPSAHEDANDNDDDSDDGVDEQQKLLLKIQQQQQAQHQLHLSLLQYDEQQKHPLHLLPLPQQQQQQQRSASSASSQRSVHFSDLLAPPPSFQDERLALLRHLKETPPQVSHGTQSFDESLNSSNNNNNNVTAPSPTSSSSSTKVSGSPPTTTTLRPGTLWSSSLSGSVSLQQQLLLLQQQIPGASSSSSPSSSTTTTSTGVGAATTHQQNGKPVNIILVPSSHSCGTGDDTPIFELPLTMASPKKKDDRATANVIFNITALHRLESDEARERQYIILDQVQRESFDLVLRFFKERERVIEVESRKKAENNSRRSLLDAFAGGAGGRKGGRRELQQQQQNQVNGYCSGEEHISMESLVKAIESAHFTRLHETLKLLDDMANDLKASKSRETDVREQLEELKIYHVDTVHFMERKFDAEKQVILKQAEENLIHRVRRMAKTMTSQDQEIMKVLRDVSSSAVVKQQQQQQHEHQRQQARGTSPVSILGVARNSDAVVTAEFLALKVLEQAITENKSNNSNNNNSNSGTNDGLPQSRSSSTTLRMMNQTLPPPPTDQKEQQQHQQRLEQQQQEQQHLEQQQQQQQEQPSLSSSPPPRRFVSRDEFELKTSQEAADDDEGEEKRKKSVGVAIPPAPRPAIMIPFARNNQDEQQQQQQQPIRGQHLTSRTTSADKSDISNRFHPRVVSLATSTNAESEARHRPQLKLGSVHPNELIRSSTSSASCSSITRGTLTQPILPHAAISGTISVVHADYLEQLYKQGVSPYYD